MELEKEKKSCIIAHACKVYVIYFYKWRNRFGRGGGPVVWQITDDEVNEV